MTILKEIQKQLNEDNLQTTLVCDEETLKRLKDYPAGDIQHGGCFYGLNIEVDNKIKGFILK